MLLHSILPHAHHDEMSHPEHSTSHQEADNLIDYLELIFHTDVGEGHLEHFETGQGLDFNIVSNITTVAILDIVTEHLFSVSGELRFIASEFYLKDDHLPDCNLHDSFSLRGPPFIS